MMTIGPKDPDEKLTLSIGFAKRANGRAITAATSTIQLVTGTDATPASVLNGTPDYSADPVVKQRVKGGVVGCTYLIRIKVTLADGDELIGGVLLTIGVGA